MLGRRKSYNWDLLQLTLYSYQLHVPPFESCITNSKKHLGITHSLIHVKSCCAWVWVQCTKLRKCCKKKLWQCICGTYDHNFTLLHHKSRLPLVQFNPQCSCEARVTVLGFCMCLSVCLSVCLLLDWLFAPQTNSPIQRWIQVEILSENASLQS